MRFGGVRNISRRLIITTFFGGLFLLCLALTPSPAKAATGINGQLNFQGRLLTASGAVVPDGYYNIEFKIYQDGDGQSVGDTTGSPAGALKWTEDYLNVSGTGGVQVFNGYMSVQLGSKTPFGSSVNWNSDTLWLSMQVGNTSNCTITTTFQSNCGGDGEMVPMKRLSASPYALNSNALNGLSSSNFVQLGQGVQTDAANVTSIAINKTGTGNIMDLQSGGTTQLSVTNSGDISFANANHTLSVATSGAADGYNLTVAAGSAGSGTHNGGNLTLQGGAASGSGTSGSVIVKSNTSDSATAFQVQNHLGNQVLGVDTSAGQVVLGSASNVNGSLLFKNSGGSNGITLNSTAANSSYTLTLPSSAPATGLCIETSPSNANQLVFASCTNNNASIQEVAEWDSNNTNTVSVSPSTIGDEMVLATQIPTAGVSVSSISGGGVANWIKVVTSANNATVHRVELWVGTVTSTGSSTITVTYSSSPGAEEIAATEFTAAGVNASTSWGIESSNSLLNSSSSTTVTYPSATAVNGSELYVGYAQVQNPPATAGSTTNFSYIQTSTQHNMITYDTSLAANTAYQPTANQNSAGQSNTVDAVLTAFVTSTSINNTTSLQKANFYVQAASSGTVAGILEAASSGTADILELKNSSGNNVWAVNSTGNVTIAPAASASAFQIQNGSSNAVLTVDTSGNKVVLGKSSALSGALSFADSGDANTITIQAPSTVAASYTLSLPTNTPTAGLCLGTSPSNANQLIFASCATQVSAASISYVNKWGNSGTSVTTISDSPASVGNLLVLFSHSTNNVTITGVSGGGVTNWTKVTSNTGITGGNDEMWRGAVTTTGSGTITVTYSSAAGTNDINAAEFSMGSTSGTWAVDTSGTTNNSSATINYPSLTPAASSELYVGYAWGANTMSAGSTSGYTYLSTSLSKYIAYNTSTTNGSAQQPTATQNTSGNYNSIAALIAAYAGTSVIVNSTAVQQANFDVQAATAGTVAGVLQGASSGSADIAQFKDGSGNNVATINATNGLTLGTAGVSSGLLTFTASGNTNTISFQAPTAPGSSYTLTLPTTTPAAGQCLATSPSNANQLVFSSCANQVTSVAITFVNNWKTSSTSPISLTVAPTNLGDLMTVFVIVKNCSLNTVTAMSGGGVAAWSKITAGNCLEMWRGQVTSTGSSTLSTTVGGPSGTFEVAAQEWTTGSSTGSWVVDTSGTLNNTSNSTTVTYPSLTPQSTKDLYAGYAFGTSAMSAGSTSGFTYFAGGLSPAVSYGTYNTSVSAAVQPTATQTSSGTSATIAALIAAYSSSSVIANSTNTQEANFNIQAATSGSVAGVLQAYITGTGDVLDILDGAGTLTDKFTSSGNLLVEPSTASASAFQVQTTGAVNVFDVDTSTSRVNIGAGSTGESSPSLLVLDNETGTASDPSGVNGAMYYNATTHTLRCYVAGAWQTCSGLLYANTSNSSSNSNCSNNCTAFSTAAAVAANYCQTGRVIKIEGTGYFNSTVTAVNLQFGIYYGTDSTNASNDVQIGTLSPAVSVSSASNNYFQIKYSIICFSTTSMQGNGTAAIQVGAAASGLTALPMNSTAGTTVVSTSAKNLYIFPIWGTANASNNATLTQLTVNGY